MPPALHVTPQAARLFALRAVGLAEPFADIAAALDHLGYIQIDPVNVCGRMHDLILRNRVRGYREGDLMRHVHGRSELGAESLATGPVLPATQRTAFEHHHPGTHILVVFPLEAWPHLLAAMRHRAKRTGAWSGRLTPRERELAPKLLEEIRQRGPLSSEDLRDERRAHRIVWGASSLVKSTLQKLFFHGELLIADRMANRRRYDLPERVLPAAVLAQKEAAAEDTARWLAHLKLRQRRLALLKRSELAAVEDAVQPLSIPGCPTCYCLRSDVPLLESCLSAKSSLRAPVRLLAPLDPLIYDRRLTKALWDFNYTWEAYVPATKRVRGHYALPVLSGTELVGHVDPKADRDARKLVVQSRVVKRGHSTANAVTELARWLGLR